MLFVDFSGGWICIGLEILLSSIGVLMIWLRCTGVFSCKKKKRYEEVKEINRHATKAGLMQHLTAQI